MYGDEPERRVPVGRSDDGNVFLQGLIGIGWVALVSLGITVAAGLLAIVIALGY